MLAASDNSRARRAFRLAALVTAHSCAASIVTPDPWQHLSRAPAGGNRTPAGAGAAVGPAGPRRTAGQTRPARGRPGRSRPSRRRSAASLPIVIMLVGLFVTGLGVEHVTGANILPGWLNAGNRPPPRKFPVLKASQPVGITIPSIRLRAVVHNVGLAPDGTIGVPPPEKADEVAWYDQSPSPGQFGPAVLVGHVDTRNAPAVFHDLDRLRPGAKVEISRQDRSVAIFEVNKVERFDKSHLPVEEVYNDFSRPGLRLITCGGPWVGGQLGYADNVVVFASLVRARRS